MKPRAAPTPLLQVTRPWDTDRLGDGVRQEKQRGHEGDLAWGEGPFGNRQDRAQRGPGELRKVSWAPHLVEVKGDIFTSGLGKEDPPNLSPVKGAPTANWLFISF